MYGRLLVEGRLVTRDVKKGIELIFQGSNDYDTRLELIRALVANPQVPLDYPDGFLYDATVAAELGEPGALAALIDLKLSRHVQFADKAGRLRAARTSGEEWRSARCQPRCGVREVSPLAALRLVALVTAKAHHLAASLHGSAVWNPTSPKALLRAGKPLWCGQHFHFPLKPQRLEIGRPDLRTVEWMM